MSGPENDQDDLDRYVDLRVMVDLIVEMLNGINAKLDQAARRAPSIPIDAITAKDMLTELKAIHRLISDLQHPPRPA